MQESKIGLANMLIGYALLFGGIIVMFTALFQVLGIFMGHGVPIKLFNFEGISINTAQMLPNIDTNFISDIAKKSPELLESIQTDKSDSEEKQAGLTKIIPAEVINGPANLGAFILLMSFAVSFGAKLSALGVSLLNRK
jgi:hypothetical protein